MLQFEYKLITFQPIQRGEIHMRFQKCLALFGSAALLIPLLTGQSAYATKPNLLLDAAARDVPSAVFSSVMQEENDSLTPYTATGPNIYTINTSSGLAQLVADLGGPLSDSLLNASITLGCDVDLGQSLWVPIGDYDHNYQGTFDGQGHTITGLSISQVNQTPIASAYAGLFSVVGRQGAVVNLNLEVNNISLSSKAAYVGAIAGNNLGRIENCHVTDGTISSDYSTGGIVGINDGDIKNCTVTNTTIAASAPSSKRGTCQAGGIVGINSYGMPGVRDGLVEACTVTQSRIRASVAADDSRALAGGIAGENRYTSILTSNVIGCEIQAKNTSSSFSSYDGDAAVAGGIVSYCFGGFLAEENNGVIICSVSGSTSVKASAAEHSYAGGIAGRSISNNHITSCTTTDITVASQFTGTGDGSPIYAGGIAGENDSSFITDCTVTNGKTTASASEFSSYAGGITGENTNGILNNCNIVGGEIRASSSRINYAGGIAGNSSTEDPDDFLTASIDTCTVSNASVISNNKNGYVGGIVGNLYGGGLNQCGVIQTTLRASSSGLHVGDLAGNFAGGILRFCQVDGQFVPDTSIAP